MIPKNIPSSLVFNRFIAHMHPVNINIMPIVTVCENKMLTIIQRQILYRQFYWKERESLLSSGYGVELWHRSKRYRTLSRSLLDQYSREKYELPYPTSYDLNGTTIVLCKNGFGIKQSTKVDMPSNKEMKWNLKVSLVLTPISKL